MITLGTFPFGEPVRKLLQQDRSPKRAFVLGVYASAVHARWLRPDGKVAVRALAVASEPYIFWRGDSAEETIRRIAVQKDAGKLEPAEKQLNGPSGIALDSLILAPLGLKRQDTWLCDLVPYSCINPAQKKAVKKHYNPLVTSLGLPAATTPELPRRLADDTRRAEILAELRESGARTLVLLGDKPIESFLKHYCPRYRKLSDFVTSPDTYGQPHRVVIDGLDLDVIALAHPRQIAKLGLSSRRWYDLHQEWLAKQRR